MLTLVCCVKEYDHLEQKPNKILIFGLLLALFGLIILQILDNFNLLPTFGNL
jgi:hypothetical protein